MLNKELNQNRGNALFLILIAVALFAALSYAITQSGRGGGGIDRETASLQASEIVQYASQIRTSIMRMKLINGCSDTNISFESPETGTLLQNTIDPAPDDSCHVFRPDGGGVIYKEISEDMLDSSNSASKYYGQPVFIGTTRIQGVGTYNGTAGRELIMTVPFVTRELCTELARNTVGLNSDGSIPQDNNISYNVSENSDSYFIGEYTTPGGFELYGLGGSSPTVGTHFVGSETGCFQGRNLPPTGTYHFYHVLIPR